jgi:hypothetical protein
VRPTHRPRRLLLPESFLAHTDRMINEKQIVGPIRSLAWRSGRLVFVELPIWQLLILATGVGVIWAGSFFGWSFVSGQSAFWQFPRGTIGGSESDMAQVLVGYLYYVHSPWGLPLFYVSALGTPVGTNVIFMDVVPVVALIGKLVHSLTGATTNLYGGYLFVCFVLPGVMSVLVLIAARIRYGLAAITAALFANAMPILLWRWGHVALEAQFLLIGALALYLFSLKRGPWSGIRSTWIAYLVVVYLTDIYLFSMIGTVWLCAMLQRRLNGYVTTQEAVGTVALTVMVVTAVIALGGQFDTGTSLPFAEYGYNSMNLLSPVLPQESGLLPGFRGIIDATGGQFDGFNYLGLGLLIASLLVLPAELGWLRRNFRRHTALLVAFVALTAFAISHRIFAGHWLLFELPMPLYLNRALGVFRGSGRYFWLIGYTQVAMVVVLAFRMGRPVMILCVVGAAILQVFDVQPLRSQILASIESAPGAQELDSRQVARLVFEARQVEVVPSFYCGEGRQSARGVAQERANMELMLATARANVATIPSTCRDFPPTVLPCWTSWPRRHASVERGWRYMRSTANKRSSEHAGADVRGISLCCSRTNPFRKR